MGKLGARELNYVSDVNLIYVVKAADADTSQQQLYRIGTKMGTMLQRVCQSVIMGVAEPALWQIDGGTAAGRQGRLPRAHTGITSGIPREMGAELGVPGAP